LAKAADRAIGGKAVLVGGAAVNLHTGSYRPTDVDLRRRHEAEPGLGLIDTYTRIKGATEAIIQAAAD